MTLDYITLIYLTFFSFFAIIFITKSSNYMLKHPDSLGSIFSKRFLKGYVKQSKEQRIFFVEFLKYPLLLLSSLIPFQLQIINIFSPSEKVLLLIPASMIFYVVLKALYISNVGNSDRAYLNFISMLDSFFFDLLLIMVIYILGKDTYQEMRFAAFFFFIGIIILKITSLKRLRYEEHSKNVIEKQEKRAERNEIFSQAVFDFSEYIHIISLLFYGINGVFVDIINFGEGIPHVLKGHFRIIIYLFLVTFIITRLEWSIQWAMKKKIVDLQIIRVKYVLLLILLLVLVVQGWNIYNGS